jgi:hypothetical protein
MIMTIAEMDHSDLHEIKSIATLISLTCILGNVPWLRETKPSIEIIRSKADSRQYYPRRVRLLNHKHYLTLKR